MVRMWGCHKKGRPVVDGPLSRAPSHPQRELGPEQIVPGRAPSPNNSGGTHLGRRLERIVQKGHSVGHRERGASQAVCPVPQLGPRLGLLCARGEGAGVQSCNRSLRPLARTDLFSRLAGGPEPGVHRQTATSLSPSPPLQTHTPRAHTCLDHFTQAGKEKVNGLECVGTECEVPEVPTKTLPSRQGSRCRRQVPEPDAGEDEQAGSVVQEGILAAARVPAADEGDGMGACVLGMLL